MIRCYCFFIILLITIFGIVMPETIRAQALQGQPLADSLLRALPKTKEDTARAKIFYKLARIYAPNDSAQAVAYANECFQLSQKHKWQTGIGLSFLVKAIIYYHLTNFSSTLENANKAYAVFVKAGNTKNAAASLVTIANSYSGSGLYTKAIEYNFKALKYYESISDTTNISTVYNNIGVCYYYLRALDKAIENYKKALALCYNLDDDFSIASGLDNIAISYLDEGEYDSANVYDLKAIPYFIKSGDLPGLARIYGNRGNILLQLHDAKQAYAFYSRSLAINKKLNITEGLGAGYGYFGELYLELANDSLKKYTIAPFMKMNKNKLLDSSEYYFLKAIELNKQAGAIEMIMSEDTLLSETEKRLGNYKAALNAFINFTVYKDSIFNDENKQKLQAMETERLTQIKDQQIKILNQQKALEASEVKRQTLIRNSIIASVIAISLLAAFLIFLYNRRKKAKFDKQVREVEMKALLAQMNPHFISNSLHSINRYVVENDKENASYYLSKFASLMRLILESSREQEVPLAQDLHALELYMQLEALRFKNKFAYSIETDPQIDKENTLIPPMLLQPFVENAIIHGVQNKENGLIKISVHKENEMICCVIEDNGKGAVSSVTLGHEESKTHKSLGKKIISERLSIINQLKRVKASVNIFDLKDANNKPSGMRVELLLPLELAF